MPRLDAINDRIIEEQDNQITALQHYNDSLKSQLDNSIPKERVEDLLDRLLRREAVLVRVTSQEERR